MTLFPHSLQNAYIGEVYEYSYDFRNKTLSQIQADGFSVWEWTVKLNANGISSNTSNARIIVNHSIQSLNNAKSLTIIQNCILSSWSNSIRLNGTWRTYATWIYMDDTQNQQLLQIGGNNTTYSWISAWTYTQKLVINFESKIATLSCTWKSDQTKTITDTEINNIYNNINNIETYVYGSNCYIKDFSIVIGY